MYLYLHETVRALRLVSRCQTSDRNVGRLGKEPFAMRLTKPKLVESRARLRKDRPGGAAACPDGKYAPRYVPPRYVQVTVQGQVNRLFHYPGVPGVQIPSSTSTLPVR